MRHRTLCGSGDQDFVLGSLCSSNGEYTNTAAILNALTRRECRIQDVNVDTDIDSRSTDPVFKLTDNSIHSNAVDVPGCQNLEATTNVIASVPFPPYQGRSDACMDGCIAN